MADPKWSKCLTPVFAEAVESLTCIITENLMDMLLTERSLTQSRYFEMIDSLRSAGIDKSNSSRDLFITLMRCPPPSFDVFCSTLKRLQGGDQLLSLLTSPTSGQVTEQESDSCSDSSNGLS